MITEKTWHRVEQIWGAFIVLCFLGMVGGVIYELYRLYTSGWLMWVLGGCALIWVWCLDDGVALGGGGGGGNYGPRTSGARPQQVYKWNEEGKHFLWTESTGFNTCRDVVTSHEYDVTGYSTVRPKK